MAVTTFKKLPIDKKLLVIKRYVKANGVELLDAVSFLYDDNPVISVWRNGKIIIKN